MIIEIKANNLIVLVKFLLKFQAMLSSYFSTHYLTIRLRARVFYELRLVDYRSYKTRASSLIVLV